METDNTLSNRIIYSALESYIAFGIKKSSIDTIAEQAGITRITAYRYFGNKKALCRASFLSVVEMFERVEDEIKQEKTLDIESALNKIKTGLSKLPRGNFISVLGELNRLYPDVFNEVNNRRIAAIKNIFEFFFSHKRQRSQLRKGLNPLFVQAFFGYMAVNIINNPVFASLGLTPEEIFDNIKTLFLHGIIGD